jgi:hypothetical protein
VTAVSATIGIDRSILGIFRESGVASLPKKTVGDGEVRNNRPWRSSRADCKTAWLGVVISGWTQGKIQNLNRSR